MGAKVSCLGGFLKPKCLWTEKKKKNMEMKQKEEQEEDYQQLTTVREAVTLEEWFLASPETPDYCFCTNGGEFYPLKHSSNKIYPSLAADFTSKPRDTTSTISLERLFKMEEMDHNDQEMGVISPISTTQSGKQKKRVCFKLPQESDIIIFYSPVVDCDDY